MSIPSRLRAIRKAAGLTQAELAARLGCTSKRVTNIEGGRRRPSLDLLEEWARACGRALWIAFQDGEAPGPDLSAAIEALSSANPKVQDAVRTLLNASADADADALATLERHLSLWIDYVARPRRTGSTHDA